MRNTYSTKQVIECYNEENKANTFENMLKYCGCGAATLRRKLKHIHAISSYNFNSRFYTLSTFVNYNNFGIWDYRGILFSSYGNLSNTVQSLVEQSHTGMTSKELEVILHVKVNDIMRIQVSKNRIIREKVGRQYVYYHKDGRVNRHQRHGRIQLSEHKISSEIIEGTHIEKDVVIAILVKIIHTGNLDTFFLKKQLEVNSINTTITDINWVIASYGFKKKRLK